MFKKNHVAIVLASLLAASTVSPVIAISSTEIQESQKAAEDAIIKEFQDDSDSQDTVRGQVLELLTGEAIQDMSREEFMSLVTDMITTRQNYLSLELARSLDGANDDNAPAANAAPEIPVDDDKQDADLKEAIRLSMQDQIEARQLLFLNFSICLRQWMEENGRTVSPEFWFESRKDQFTKQEITWIDGLLSEKNYQMLYESCLAEANANNEKEDSDTEKELPSKKTKVDTKNVSCQICLENNVEMALACGHKNACNGCLKDMIQLHIKEKNSKALICLTCKKPMSQSDIAQFTNQETAQKFDETQRDELLMSDPHLKHCPTPNCGYMYIKEDNKPQKITCPTCKQSYCANCRETHESKVPCKIQMPAAWTGHGIKQCPNCHEAIQKNEGCIHMTCKCGHNFCWKCSEPMNQYGQGTCKCVDSEDEDDSSGDESDSELWNLINS